MEGGLAPLEEGVALAVALELERRVEVVGVGGAELIDLHGVVDDQLGGLQRVDLVGIAAERLHGVAHGGKIDDGGDAGEVLHEDAGGHVGDLAGGLGGGVPGREEANILCRYRPAVLVAQQVFEQDAQGEGKPGEIGALLGERLQAEEMNLATTVGERGGSVEGVRVRLRRRHGCVSPKAGSG